MSGYIGSKAVNLSTTGADINGDAIVDGTLDVLGAFTSLGIDDNAAATAITIDASGDVGIGTAAPAGRIHSYIASAGVVSVNTAADGVVIENSSQAGMTILTPNTGTGNIFFGDPDNNVVGRLRYDHSVNAMSFWTDGVERMRIDASANMLLGSTANVGASRLFVKVAGGGVAITTQAAASGTYNPVVFRRFDGTTVGLIQSNDVGTTYNTSSDYRLKENITPIQGAGDIVKAMRPATYTFKADGSWADGFIAHELQELHPVAVTGSKDEVDEEGNPVYQGVDYSKLTPILTAALQEALTKIDDLTARIATLEAAP
tara:strand:+ start:1524 stop:2471 length:948 start_codon:yes stop_codon:yes gene_type:complete